MKNIRRKWKKNTTMLATLNVRTLLQPGKLKNEIREIERFKWKIIGWSEMRWNGLVTIQKEGHTIFFFGHIYHTHGIGFIVEKSLNPNIKKFIAISDRVALLNLKVSLKTICGRWLQTNEIYEQMDSVLKHCKNNERFYS